MTRGQRRTVIGIIVLAVAALVIYGVATRGRPKTQPAAPAAAPGPAPAAPRPPTTAPAPVPLPRPPVPRPPSPTTGPVPVPPPAGGRATPAERARAAGLMEQGLQLAAGKKFVAARSALADALNTGALPAGDADAVRRKLTELVNETLFSHRKHADDPCVVWHKFKYGDTLVRLERTLKLHVPTQLLLKINGIADAGTIQAGQTLKLIRGPFHAVISKGAFALDL